MPLSTIRYVNAYEVSRHYGGPEEGGWWFDAGTPLASVPCVTDEAVDEAKTHLQFLFGPAYEGNRDRHSVIGEENLEIFVEDTVATPFPAETPHYE